MSSQPGVEHATSLGVEGVEGGRWRQTRRRRKRKEGVGEERRGGMGRVEELGGSVYSLLVCVDYHHIKK